MKTISWALAFVLAIPGSSVALADQPAKGGSESPTPIVGKAPAASAPKDTDAKVATRSGPLFETGDFDAPDPVSDRLVKTVEERCFSEPRSREGMSPAESKRCDAAVAKLVQRGAKAVGSILTSLNAELDMEHDYSHYYARTRLYHVLGRTDDPKVEDVLIRGYARITASEDQRFINDMTMIESALVGMNAADPVGLAAFEKSDVTDPYKTGQDNVMTWRLWQRAHAGTPKAELRASELATARKEKSSKDLRKSFLALSTLAELSPNEALKAVQAIVEREDLADDDKAPFYAVEDRAYQNGAVETADDEPPPVPMKKAKKSVKKSRKKNRL